LLSWLGETSQPALLAAATEVALRTNCRFSCAGSRADRPGRSRPACSACGRNCRRRERSGRNRGVFSCPHL